MSEVPESFKNIKMYMVMNTQGKLFKRRGYWVDSPTKAKIYTKMTRPRAIISSFFNKSNDLTTLPVILEINFGEIKIINET